MKKRLLAALLSVTMLTAEVMPVIAAGDEVVSENAAVEEEAAEEAEGSDEIVGFDGILLNESVREENGEKVVESDYLVGFPSAGDAVSVDDAAENADKAETSAPNFIYVGAQTDKKITAEPYIYNSISYPVDATVTYFSRISYRGKPVKAQAKDNYTSQLYAVVNKSALYDMAAKLSPAGTYRTDVINFTFSAKKNKNANSGSYFIVKASVKGKVAKEMGIKGKDLAALKKAVKQFNKAAKLDPAYFTIDPVSFDAMTVDPDTYLGLTIHFVQRYLGSTLLSAEITGVSVRCLTRPEQLDQVSKRWTKYTKPSKKDVTVKKVATSTYTMTANNINYASRGYYTVGLVKQYGKYYYNLSFTQTH